MRFGSRTPGRKVPPTGSARGLQCVVFVHRNHDSRFATETDDVVTVVL